MTIYTVDRFEGNIAVLLLREDETKQIDVLLNKLPSNIKEGDIVKVAFDENNNLSKAKILKEETQKAKETAENLLQKILKKNE